MDRRPILLVEDNPDDVALTLRAFKKVGITNPVVVARNGVQALDWLFVRGEFSDRDPEETPSIILLDLKLPKLDGLEVLRQLRANASTHLHRVIVLTSSREDHDILQSYDHGANSYIRKPVDFDRFLEGVGQIGLYWLNLNESPPQLAH
ncbi:MAG: response regulator [Fibrobacteria bacterium]|nr:response regulator [Fibrobacteria bacterium]